MLYNLASGRQGTRPSWVFLASGDQSSWAWLKAPCWTQWSLVQALLFKIPTAKQEETHWALITWVSIVLRAWDAAVKQIDADLFLQFNSTQCEDSVWSKIYWLNEWKKKEWVSEWRNECKHLPHSMLWLRVEIWSCAMQALRRNP